MNGNKSVCLVCIIGIEVLCCCWEQVFVSTSNQFNVKCQTCRPHQLPPAPAGGRTSCSGWMSRGWTCTWSPPSPWSSSSSPPSTSSTSASSSSVGTRTAKNQDWIRSKSKIDQDYLLFWRGTGMAGWNWWQNISIIRQSGCCNTVLIKNLIQVVWIAFHIPYIPYVLLCSLRDFLVTLHLYWCPDVLWHLAHLFLVKCFVILAIGIFIYTPQSMVMGLIMYAMTKHYYLLCFMFVIKISQLWPGDHSKTMFVFYTFYFLWTLNHGSCGLLFERTNNISVSSFEAARNMSLQV